MTQVLKLLTPWQKAKISPGCFISVTSDTYEQKLQGSRNTSYGFVLFFLDYSNSKRASKLISSCLKTEIDWYQGAEILKSKCEVTRIYKYLSQQN